MLLALFIALIPIKKDKLVRDSGAKQVDVTSESSADRVWTWIRDGVKSFDLDKMSAIPWYGAAKMRPRGRSIGSDINISSESSEATSLFGSVLRDARA